MAGTFAGGSKTIVLYSSRKTASASQVPATENDHTGGDVLAPDSADCT